MIWRKYIHKAVLRLPDSSVVELEFGNVGFWGENRSVGRKTSRSKGENQQQTQPTYGVDGGIWTRATLMVGERSHHCAIPCTTKGIG